MRSIRTRLTLAYAGAMIGTMLALATALYSERRVSVMRELEARLNAQADFAVQLVDLARDISPSQLSVTPDSVVTSGILPRMKPLMDLLPNYVVVIDRRGFNMYRSDAVERLLVDQKGRIDSVARAMKRDSSIVTVNLIRSTLLMTGRNVRQTPSSTIDRVFVAMSVDETETQLRELLGTIVVIAPFLIALSVVFAYSIAGRAFRPIDRIIDQVEAISDGRSLHRRLASGAAGDELARLSATLNAMIGRLETSFGALRRFTADASHELKTPLTVIRADVERAMSPNASSNDKAVALEEALQQVTRMADLVDSLLTLARADEGRFDLHREPVDLGPLVKEVV